MSADMTRNQVFTVCTTGGWTATAVQKRGSVSERFSYGLENEYRSQTGLETLGDNNDRGDIKVDNKARGDIKVDNKMASYNARKRSVQHPLPLPTEMMLGEQKVI